MNDQMPFEQVWDTLCRELASPKKIRNWTVYWGHIGRGDFTAQAEDDTHIVCTLISGSKVEVPQDDFEVVYQVWSQYLSRKTPRYMVRDMTRHSKYIISILHHFLMPDA
jgi:hypothetical protein